ncbi:unnamed protein product [Clonostachys solani]|uniref:Thioredoxin domain-containing protein n=1 Tax=Clonostachys solani TaxID=160281 RepID=A0A9N9Z197_9HYPO|nr:unnamed protein product [Clonostachys solani]
MPILKDFQLPASAAELDLSGSSNSTLFIAFISSADPRTGAPWCPDVRATLPHIREAFASASTPDLVIAEVGQIPEWRDSKNVFRTKWDVHNVPTLARFKLVNGKVSEKGRLVEGDLLDAQRLSDFIKP